MGRIYCQDSRGDPLNPDSEEIKNAILDELLSIRIRIRIIEKMLTGEDQ